MPLQMNILDFLRRAESGFGNRTSVIDEPDSPGSLGKITYRRLAAIARAQAAALDRLQVPTGGRVAIVSKNSARFLASFFGVSGYGRVLVPINYRLNDDDIKYIVRHSGAEVAMLDSSARHLHGQLPCRITLNLDGSDDRQLYHFTHQPKTWQANENAPASINYTSGTTARPKGVVLTHRNLYLNAVILGFHLGLSEDEAYLHTLPMFHCNGWGMPYLISAVGGCHVIQEKILGDQILRRICDHGVTILNGAPTVMAMILEAKRQGAYYQPRRPVRTIVAGAAPPASLIDDLQAELGWEFIQIYGLTETSPLLTVNRRRTEWQSDIGAHLSRAGTKALGVDCEIASDGEIKVRGHGVLSEYWQDPAASAEAIQDGWFHTGDGGVLEDGYLTINDRKKDMIISGGENVSSIEVENLLYQHPEILEAAVIGVPDPKWGEVVCTLVVKQPNSRISAPEIIEFCRQNLAHFKCPKEVRFVESLPRTLTGKLQKYKLRNADPPNFPNSPVT